MSRNNAIVTEEVAMQTLAPSIKNKPIRGHYIRDDEDFGGHEAYTTEDENGEITFERETIPMGVFTSEGYVEEIEINGVFKRVLVADAVMWYSQFKKPIDLLVSWFNENITISMSCEYLYNNYEMIDGIEYHKSPIYLESHCILGREIIPAYESASLINYNQLNEFKQLVAQAINQNNSKEEEVLTEEVKNEEVEQIETEETEVVETTEEIVEKKKQEEVVETIEESQVDVKDIELNELREKLAKVESEKNELAEKYNKASETIVSLNEQIEELKPLQEQMLNAQREQKLDELTQKFSKAFSNAKANEKFNSEEVQTLLNEAIDSPEALFKLNEMVVDLIAQTNTETIVEESMLIGLNSQRKNLVEDTVDEFDKIFKL